jgi:hypothetical protein
MTMNRRVILIVGLAVILVAVLLLQALPGGHRNALGAGPLGTGGFPAAPCFPVGHGYGRGTIGVYTLLQNDGETDASAIIQRVTLDDPRGVTLLAADVGYLGRHGSYVSYEPVFPPTGPWTHVPAHDAVIVEDSKQPEWLLLGVGLTTTKTGEVKGIYVSYTSIGQQYELLFPVAFTLYAGTECPA